jgi:hypothetical protein
MHDAGIHGFYLMPIKSVSDEAQFQGDSEQLSDNWWRHIDHTFHIADSLHLQMGIHFSDGFALGGGPWIKPEESMQRIVWSDTVVELGNKECRIKNKESLGNKECRIKNKELRRRDAMAQADSSLSMHNAQCRKHNDECAMARADSLFFILHSLFPKDSSLIAVYAYPAKYYDPRKPKSSVAFPFRSADSCAITMTYDSIYTLRSVRIVTGGNNYQAHRFAIYASNDGLHFRFVRQLQPARQGWQNTDAQASYSVPATAARYFQFRWSPRGSEPGSEDMDAAKWKPVLKVADIQLSSEPVVDGFEGKSGAVWRVSSSFPIADNECLSLPMHNAQCTMHNDECPMAQADSLFFILHSSLPQDSSLKKWHILRISHASTGHTNATGGGGRGLECDKFSRAAIDKQFEHWFAAIYNHVPRDVARRVLTRLHVDSWECGSQNWSDTFAAEFRCRRGYDLMPWLPLFAGVPIESSARSDSVLRDVRLTISELVNDVFFDEVESLAHKYGCRLSVESVAPTMVSDGMSHYLHADLPMGEFWLNSPTHDKPNDRLDAVSGAHVYGKRTIQAEGFTQLRSTWDEHPAMLKTLLDRNYCTGMNALVFHVNVHNPWLDRRPGMTLDGIGTFFQRDQTWWTAMPAFTSYISRCQSLLQDGAPVVDIAVYTGDEVPRRAILPERLISSLPGLYGADLISRESARLRNEGQPMEISPVGVSHTANIPKAEDWINPLHGYAYDSFNHEALAGCHVDHGEIVTAAGMRYRVLVIPQSRPMNPDCINTMQQKIDSLKRLGARIIDSPWTESDLSSIGIVPDATLPVGLAYNHRHTSDADIYFISNQTDTAVTFPVSFRASGKYHYLANPMNGEVRVAGETISLSARASCFYVVTDSAVAAMPREDNNAFTVLKTNFRPWKITFLNTGKRITSDSLFDWTTSKAPSIKYYSGTAVYTTTFNIEGRGRSFLDLGNVQNIASVYVNGICCGTVWMAPYMVDITSAVKAGKNTLKIDVTNTWANALLGSDLGTPPFAGIWTNAKYRRAEKTLLPAGLLGPEIKMIVEK